MTNIIEQSLGLNYVANIWEPVNDDRVKMHSIAWMILFWFALYAQ